MITIDTSALMAILIGEPLGPDCAEAVQRETDIKISACTAAEALIVAAGRGIADAMTELIEGLAADIIPLDAAAARHAAEAYRRWGRGFHPAALNFGDCFAYEVASRHGGKLRFVGDDFARTDLDSVLPTRP